MEVAARYLRNFAYIGLLAIALPWLMWQSFCHGKYRHGLVAKFWGRVPVRLGVRPCIWLHAVSVGEVNVVATILPRLEQQWPEHDFYITTTTQSGYAVAQKRFVGWQVSYAPLDFSWAVQQALRRIRPTALLLVELELWPNLIALAHQADVRIAITNGRLSRNSFAGYQRIKSLLSTTLRSIDVIAVQNETYRQRFVDLGAEPNKVVVTGSVKFDGAETNRHNPRTDRLRRLAKIQPQQPILVAGSTQYPEESVAIETWRRLRPDHPDGRLILVPRHPERFDEVARMLDQTGLSWSRRSQLREGDPVEEILLVDTIGELGGWWGVADVAFVGGSLGNRGGQNMIEPAAYGAAVCFGPNTKNFRDVTEALMGCDGARIVQDGIELTAFVRECFSDLMASATMGRRAQQLVESQRGATEHTVALLSQHVLPHQQPSSNSPKPTERPSRRALNAQPE